MDLGYNIKKIRELKNMTQAELGKKVGVSRTAISSWEVNRTEPSLDDLDKLAESLGCLKSDLIGSDEVPVDYHFLINDDEKALIELYRSSPDEIKDFLVRYLNAYHQLKQYKLSDILKVAKENDN